MIIIVYNILQNVHFKANLKMSLETIMLRLKIYNL